MWFGFGLIIVGLVLLLNNMGILKGDSWNYFWPLMIIFVGVYLIFNRKKVDSIQILKKDSKDDKKEA